jgi:AcrR family transcriptional regulator
MQVMPDTRERRRPPRVSRDFVLLWRRRRLASAATEVIREFGRAGATITAVVSRARTARATFYDCFTNMNECLAFGVADAHERLLAPVREAAAGEARWPIALSAGLGGFYRAVAAEPLVAELLLIHSFAVDLRPGQAGLEAAVADLQALIARGRAEAAGLGPEPAALAEECWARAVLARAKQALLRSEEEALVAAVPPLVDLILEASHGSRLLYST